jgi:ribonuclease PH
VQGTAEGAPFSEPDFLALMALARRGIATLMDLQRQATA